MSVSTLFKWDHTIKALNEMENLLTCKHCKKMLDNPQRSTPCDHIFCKHCLKNVSKRATCPICNGTCKKVTNTHIFDSIMEGYRTISDMIGLNRGKEKKKHDSTNAHILNTDKSSSDEISNKKDSIDGIIKISAATTDCTGGPSAKKSKVDNEQPVETKHKGKQVNKKNIPRSRKQERERGRKPLMCNFREKNVNDMNTNTGEEATFDATAGKTVTWATNIENMKRKANTPSKDILKKRNNKGETPLHVACIKGIKEQVKSLLERGADPCTKDHAGWTPLHEAVSKGFLEIVHLLLKAGALVNAPGCYNNTPLHDAVINNHIEAARILISYGADPDIRNIEGNTPRFIARTDEMKAILEDRSSVTKVAQDIRKPRLPAEDVVLLGCDFDTKQHSKLTTLVRKCKIKMNNIYTEDVTHIVIAGTSKISLPSVPVLQGILQGKWIVNFRWLEHSLEKKDPVEPDVFQVTGTTNFPNSEAPMKGRLNKYKLLPSLFNGCHFYLASGNIYSVGSHIYNKEDLNMLIRSGGGVILKREPDPEAIPPLECTVPFHAKRDEQLAQCSHYVIYQPGKHEPQLKYNMSHVKSLPVSWLLQCIEKFSLTLL